jgi:hypothetical protein
MLFGSSALLTIGLGFERRNLNTCRADLVAPGARRLVVFVNTHRERFTAARDCRCLGCFEPDGHGPGSRASANQWICEAK